MKRTILITALLALALGACGHGSAFRLSGDENNEYALKGALARRQLPAQPTPVNASGQPRVFVLAAGAPKTIIAYDLAAGNVLWKTDADVQSRIAVGGDFIVAVEGKQLVARDQARGAPRWKVDLGGTFVGAAADRDRAYLVTKGGGNSWRVAAYSGSSGSRLWSQDAAGQLGAPAANGGLVYVPFLSQWLSILDGKTGEQLTRLRGLDEQISTVQATSTTTYYGSKAGVFRLDQKSATGKRDRASYARVTWPAQLERTSYAPEAYDPVQQGYTASDRARVLFTTEPGEGPLTISGGGYVVHYFRFLFGFALDGTMRWAYSHPRVELVASTHTGRVVAGVSTSGDIVAVDPETGGVRAKQSLGIAQQVLGATFDADGWAPTSESGPAETVPALVSIARDHDARFDRVKELAVIALAKQPGPQVSAELLAVLDDDRAPQRLKDTVVDLLAQRRDPASLPILTAQLAVRTDYLAGTEADTLSPIAKAIAGLGAPEVALDPKHVTAALAALQVHLDAPTTASPDLAWVIAAMAAIGRGAERPALISHLLLYHADDDLGSDATWQKAIVTALATGATPADRAALAYVAGDPRSKPGLVQQIGEVLGAP